MRKKIVATTEGGAITGEERLREHTDQLYGAILSYEGKPAAYQITYIDTLKRELDEGDKTIRSTPRAGPARIKRLAQVQRPTTTFDSGEKVGTNDTGQMDRAALQVQARPSQRTSESPTKHEQHSNRETLFENIEWFCGRLEVSLSCANGAQACCRGCFSSHRSLSPGPPECCG